GINEFVQQAQWNLLSAHDSIIASRILQSHQVNKKRTAAPPYQIGQLVYLSTKNLSLPKGRARKLLPKYIGPYPITEIRSE
ncbi:hypothetical protein SISSUDRAFT_971594, partial [Sistotremastrum suecicum HHB10207 ss-3]